MFVKKDSKGITLIALVITIIVLLILAGITIAFLTGENSIFGKATNAKIENEKAEIKEMLSLSVNTISVERGQKQDSLSNYYNEKETFIEKGKLDTTKYKINNYEYNEENKIVTITIYKENGTQNQYEYEINLGTGGIEFKNRGEIVDPNKANKISYETNGGSFAEGTDVVTEYKKGDIVGFISPVKEGAAFDGWYLNNNFDGESITKITKDMDGDITVYAKWLVETDPSYFEYSTIDGQDALIGFSDIGKKAYDEGQENVINLVIPKKNSNGRNIVIIGQSAFKNCSKIKKLIIPNEVSNIKEYSFGYCTGLKELTIPITIDASYANGNYSCNFQDCTGLNIIKFTKGTTGIGYDYSNYYYTPWYKSNNNKKIIIIDKEIISIGKNIFNGLNNVAYYYTGSQEEWANVSVDSSNAITIDQYNYKE